MHRKHKIQFVEDFEDSFLGKYEKLDKDKINEVYFGQMESTSVSHITNEARVNLLDTFILSTINFHIKNDTLFIESPDSFIKMDLTDVNFELDKKHLHYSFGTHYSIIAKNSFVEACIGYFPPHRKEAAEEVFIKIKKLIEEYFNVKEIGN